MELYNFRQRLEELNAKYNAGSKTRYAIFNILILTGIIAAYLYGARREIAKAAGAARRLRRACAGKTNK